MPYFLDHLIVNVRTAITYYLEYYMNHASIFKDMLSKIHIIFKYKWTSLQKKLSNLFD